MYDTSFDLVAATSTDHRGLAVNVEIQFTFKDEVGLIPGMGVRRLANATRGGEFGDAVLPVGLFSSKAQGDGVPQDVANLWLVEKNRHEKSNLIQAEVSSYGLLFVGVIECLLLLAHEKHR